MTDYDLELREGGHIAYTWEQRATGQSFRLAGHYEVVDGEHRIVHVEWMHLPDPTPDMRVETLFQPDGIGTRLVMTMTLDDPAAMEAMIATGMADGMEASYRRFDAMAVGVVKALEAAGRKDILVVGFDNIPAVGPMIEDGRMLATVDQFGQQMAADVIDKALAVVAGGPALEGWVKTDIALVTKK